MSLKRKGCQAQFSSNGKTPFAALKFLIISKWFLNALQKVIHKLVDSKGIICFKHLLQHLMRGAAHRD